MKPVINLSIRLKISAICQLSVTFLAICQLSVNPVQTLLKSFDPNLHPREPKGEADNEIPRGVAKWGREGVEFEGRSQ